MLNGMKSSRGCGYIGCKAPLWMCVALAGWLAVEEELLCKQLSRRGEGDGGGGGREMVMTCVSNKQRDRCKLLTNCG